jgi:hypothetical protein
VSAIDRCPLYRGLIYKSLTVALILRDREKVSAIDRCPLYRVSAIDRYDCMTVPMPTGPLEYTEE